MAERTAKMNESRGVRQLGWGCVGLIGTWLAPCGAGSTWLLGVIPRRAGINRAGVARENWSRARFGSVGGRLAGLGDEPIGQSPKVMYSVYIYIYITPMLSIGVVLARTNQG
jgi:hypothetical protein